MTDALRSTALGAAAALALTAGAALPLPAQRALYRSDAFTVTDTAVQQGRFTAVALSRDTLVSTYPRSGREVHYRFSLNGEDNEFRSGTDHTLYIRPTAGKIVSPLHVFGQEQPPFLPTPEAFATSEEGTAQVTIRLDLRQVLQSFREKGYYDPPLGTRIRRQDFRGVYAVGDVAPLSWDFASLRPGAPTQLTDPDGDGIYTLSVPIEARYTRPALPDGRAIWTPQTDLAGFPQLRSPERLLDALYRMSLDELNQLRNGRVFDTGAKWGGVWTRDLAYAVMLGLVFAAPDEVRNGLLVKVDSLGRIIQDTGTGGSWPVSTDRMTWALAAWELYAATGDAQWLRQAYDIIRRSAEADQHAALERATGLMLGETSFLDWREQEYPRWADPRDIAQSTAIGTNVVHFATYRILADMARALGEPAERWDGIAEGLKQSINQHLWLPQQRYYSLFRYGRLHPALSSRSDGLGQALAVIYGAAPAERRARLVESAPVVAFGMPSLWPYIPNIPSYHNNSVWPFVTGYWMWAAADAGNTAAVEHALASIYRPAALFLTNKENLVASTGHFDGTELNSDRQLWSVAANLATHYRVLFGLRLQPDRLVFRPMVPPGYDGERRLSGLRYRGARLSITVRGHGDGIATIRLDGQPLARPELPATLTGEHAVEIQMNGRWPAAQFNLVADRFSPETPVAEIRGDLLTWSEVPGAVRYELYRNGRWGGAIRPRRVTLAPDSAVAEYQVLAVDSLGVESFLSEPVRREPAGSVLRVQPPAALLEREHAGFTGNGYVKLTKEQHTTVEIPVQVACGGLYAIDARYANGSGPINTDSKAALRTLMVDGQPAGVLVMPQRGLNLWTEWRYSTAQKVRLAPGAHTLTLRLTALDENMDRRVNTALLDHLRLSRLESECGR